MSKFYVYQNRMAGDHAGVIHHGDCGNCKCGKGKTTGTRPENGEWSQAFSTAAAADAYARGRFGKVRHCKVCL